MEMFWPIVFSACWILGTILACWEVATDEELRKNAQEFGDLIAVRKQHGSFFGVLATMFYCLVVFLVVFIVCALWPIWKIGDVIMIFSKKGKSSK